MNFTINVIAISFVLVFIIAKMNLSLRKLLLSSSLFYKDKIRTFQNVFCADDS